MPSGRSSFCLRLAIFISVVLKHVAADEHHRCSQEDLLKCSLPLKVITDKKSFVTNKQELDLQCPQLVAGLHCIDNFTRNCMNGNERKDFMQLYAGTREFIRDLCRDGNYQKEFLQHAPCMRKVREDVILEKCTKDYENKLHSINSHNRNNGNSSLSDSENEYHVKTICCSFQTYVQCSLDAIERICGPESTNFTSLIFARMASPLTQNHCKKYSDGQNCDFNSAAALWSTGIQGKTLTFGLLISIVVRQFFR